MSDSTLLASLGIDVIRDAIRESDRLATLAIFGERGQLSDPESVAFNAGATELVAARLAREGTEGATVACREAFELLRGVLTDPQLKSQRTPLEEQRVALRAVCFGVLGDVPSQARQLLHIVGVASHQTAEDWGQRVHLSAVSAWQRLIGRQGWSDLDAVHAILSALRADQETFEPPFLGDRAGQAPVAWSLIASYHLVRAAEIVAEFTEHGEVGGNFDPVEQSQMHFDRARDAADQAGDAELAFTTVILELTAARLVASSIWTAARGAGSRAKRFVGQLSSRARPRPILDLLPPQRRALVEAGLIGTGRRSVVVSLPTSAGKTLVAEFRILQALDRYEDQSGWVAYTAPTRALVNQITSRLRRDLGDLGIRVEKFSPALEVDSVEAELLENSKDPFRVIVTTPEKLDLLLRGGWTEDLGRPLTLLIVDEAHNLGVGSRGLRLELLLATVNREHRDASFMLLTPFVPNASEIAAWLDPTNNESVELSLEWMPNDRVIGLACLEKGPKRGDSVVWAQTVVASKESLQTDDRIVLSEGRPLGRTFSALNSPGYLAAATAHSLEGRGATVTLVQRPDHSWSLAEAIGAQSVRPATDDLNVQAVQTVLRQEYGESYPLVGLLGKQIGVHHAGLSDDVRSMVEALAERDLLRHIVATTTLAQGINFPISNVVLASHQYPYGVDMPPEDFWNIAGRAGRADRGQAGVVLLSAPGAERELTLRRYVTHASDALASTLVQMVAEAMLQSEQLDLAQLSFRGEWSAFVQFITHTYRVVGANAFGTQVEQVLRGTLGYRALRSEHPAWADALLQGVQRYTSDLAGKPISLVDSTGFSWQSVSATLARLSDAGLGGEVWGSELFDSGSSTLKDAIGILLKVPELREQLVERLDTSESEGDFLSRVVKDWVAGSPLAEMASNYFASDENGKHRDPTRSLTVCCQRLFSSILPTVSWGLSALQALNLAGHDGDVDPGARDVPSFVYYGVNSREAVALRLFGVPRGAASALATALAGDSATTDALRRQLATSTSETWKNALGDVGEAYFRAWSLVEGAA